MDNQLVRLFIFIVLLFLLTADIKDILQALSTTATLGPYLTGWRPSHHHIQRRSSPSSGDTSSTPSRKVADKELGYKSQPQVQGGARLKVFYPSPKGRKKLRDIEATGTAQQEYVGRRVRHISQEEIFATLTEEEKQELTEMRSQMTKVMQESCLPKLVCELHKNLDDRASLTEAEQGLVTIIKETSMNPLGESSKYHFAAHMGQLLANVEGNGCHNFYPNCPLSGTKVLQMVKKVRIK